MANHFSGSERVILQFNSVQTPRFPGFRHNAAFHYMQRMQLYAVHAGFNHSLQRLQTFSLPLRQAGQQLSESTPSAHAHAQLRRALIAGKIMTAIYAMQCFVVGGL
mgnify:CR=1 FL=1